MTSSSSHPSSVNHPDEKCRGLYTHARRRKFRRTTTRAQNGFRSSVDEGGGVQKAIIATIHRSHPSTLRLLRAAVQKDAASDATWPVVPRSGLGSKPGDCRCPYYLSNRNTRPGKWQRGGGRGRARRSFAHIRKRPTGRQKRKQQRSAQRHQTGSGSAFPDWKTSRNHGHHPSTRKVGKGGSREGAKQS